MKHMKLLEIVWDVSGGDSGASQNERMEKWV
jgi:hypothetical protein